MRTWMMSWQFPLKRPIFSIFYQNHSPVLHIWRILILMQCNSLIMLYDLFEQAFWSFLWSPWWSNYSKPGLYMEEIWIQNLITALLFTKNYVVNLQNLQKQASNRHHKYWDFILPSLRFTLYKLPLRSQETHHQFSPFQETKKNIFWWWQSLWICP